MARIGFIGLGNMGLPMAANLVMAGHQVTGFDVVAANCEAATGRGIAKAKTASDAAKGADAVVTMLPAGKHVLSVYGEGVLEAASRGTVFIDSSTIDVASARAAHDMAGKAGMLSVDAPVSGGVAGAEGATLTFMAGGSQDAFAKAEPLMSKMGRRVVHCGDAGAGQAAKICNNMMLGIAMIGCAEGFVLAEKLGLSHKALFDVASTSSGMSWALMNHCPVPGLVPTSAANRDYKPGFAANLMTKDLMLSQEAARASGASTPMGAEAAQLFQLFVANGSGALDYTAIINFLRGKRE